MKRLNCLFLLFACCAALMAQENRRIDLSGYWKLFIDTQQKYSVEQVAAVPYNDTIVLPATLDEAQKGERVTWQNTGRLSRKYSFAGRAWYQKEIIIPQSWEGEVKLLHLERTKVTHVWVDEHYVGNSLLIASSQQYDLTPWLSTGVHQLTILVDNGATCGLPEAVYSSHQWSDETQTNWNGIVGQLFVAAKPAVDVSKLQAYSHVKERSVELRTTIYNTLDEPVEVAVAIYGVLFNSAETHAPAPQDIKVTVPPGGGEFVFNYALGAEAKLWNEYTPNLYRIQVELSASGVRRTKHAVTVGLRQFVTQGRHLTMNGTRVFLRGKHDGCVFPLTGYAPTNVADWMRYFDILRTYGFNHVRFHSWCPLEAAFEAADLKGFYLQAELPLWGAVEENPDAPINTFLIREGKGIMDCFGNHASFVGFATGNELWGSIEGMKGITRTLRAYDGRHLYALGSNFNLGWLGEQGDEDFIVACRVGGQNDASFEPHVRSSFSFTDAIDGGLLNATYPNTRMNFDTGVSNTNKPVIGHETGQFQVYPNSCELKKYTGVLYPHNLISFVERTNRKHGIAKSEQFFRASGALSLLCYKADVEMSLRTEELSGYQMLDIQDFPGQGTALVGMLDSFMDSKGLTTPEEFTAFNAEVVPLWLASSYTWYNDETLSGEVKLFNYPEHALTDAVVEWKLCERVSGVVRQSGSLAATNLSRGLARIGDLQLALSGYVHPVALQLELRVSGTNYANTYPLWVYPRKASVKKPADVTLFTSVTPKLYKHLVAGKKALLIPTAHAYPNQTVGGLFTSDYWNYSMFKTISENAKKPVSPGTLGYLIADEHPLFHLFPTSTHSDWQWWAPARHASPLIMDNLDSEVGMIVEGIDNVERNHKLGLLFECKVGKGKLLVCMADVLSGSAYKECNQLLKAMYQYLGSEAFNPQLELTVEEINLLFTGTAGTPKIEGVRNVSY
ncbi:sugar-binding domain-containing protein [Bacteroides sp. 214]|uniref:sugar-binding domain-containing protein n=1 Tax=Bacteroides sp. 214 TaxID=2302935 RepID=UPI0013D5B515|nr:sugar-binding domain-containing protein [Bacteroides sp. 214]